MHLVPLTPVDASDVRQVVALVSPQVRTLIDEARAVERLDRMGGAALVKLLADELPPDDRRGKQRWRGMKVLMRRVLPSGLRPR